MTPPVRAAVAFLPASSSFSSEPGQARTPPVTPLKQKPKRRAQPPKKPRKPKAGWGPYHTVVNERAVVFNLTLDVQHLQQEVRSLTAARDILLAARSLHRRHDPSGSLMKAVTAYYDVIRFGITPESTNHSSSTNKLGELGRRSHRTYTQKEQREFLQNFVDEEIDCGGGLVGVDVFFEQLRRYSVFMRYLDIHLLTFEVVNADDTVLIITTGSLHIQILRGTIAGVFPHVLGYEWLVSKLVGHKVAIAATVSFYFNQRDKVTKYVVDLDFLKAFADLLADPEEVDILFGRALIGDNCMFAAEIGDEVSAAPAEPVKEEDTHQLTIRRAVSRRGAADGEDLRPVVREVSVLPPASVYSVAGTRTSGQRADDVQPSDFYNQVVWEYFDVFSRVTHRPSDGGVMLSDAQRGFVLERVSPTCEFGDEVDEHGAALRVGQHVLKERWYALTSCFEFLGLVQTSQDPVVMQPRENLCFVRATAEYVLRVTHRTIQSVFPHVASEDLLVHTLLGGVLTVHAQLKFWLERASGAIACLKEEMNFDAALAQLVTHLDDLAWVLKHARLQNDGVRSDVLLATNTTTTSSNNSTNNGTSTSSLARETMTSYDISV